ncbi:MAG: imidazolonepropionase, partial [Neolewinella sp.]
MMTLTGPFTQLLPLTDIPVRGKLADEQLSIIPNAGILTDHGKILATGNFNDLREET